MKIIDYKTGTDRPSDKKEMKSILQELTEEPCEDTKEGCRWIWDDWKDHCDMYCLDCKRYRDWSKESLPDPDLESLDP